MAALTGPDNRQLLDLNARGRRLRAALAAVLVRAHAPELALVHRWLDSRPASGWSSAAWRTKGYDLQLYAYGGRDWLANYLLGRDRSRGLRSNSATHALTPPASPTICQAVL
jgi:hypothetical protein